jgi:hypothetical protein
MSRNAIAPITQERIRQLESLPAEANPRLRTQDIAYILGITTKSLRAKAREHCSFRKVVKRYSPKGELFAYYQELMKWIDIEDQKLEARRMAL